MAVDLDTPLWLLCPYDAGSLSEDVLAEAHRSHPVVVDGEVHRGSVAYGGAHHVATMFESDLTAVDIGASHLPFGPDSWPQSGPMSAPARHPRACHPTRAPTWRWRCTRSRSTASSTGAVAET